MTMIYVWCWALNEIRKHIYKLLRSKRKRKKRREGEKERILFCMHAFRAIRNDIVYLVKIDWMWWYLISFKRINVWLLSVLRFTISQIFFHLVAFYHCWQFISLIKGRNSSYFNTNIFSFYWALFLSNIFLSRFKECKFFFLKYH